MLDLLKVGTVGELRSDMCEAVASLAGTVLLQRQFDVTMDGVRDTAAFCLEMTAVHIFRNRLLREIG